MENIARRGGRGHGVLVSAVLAAGLVASVAAAASDGRIPIGTLPYTITAGGSYYLTGDLINTTNSPAITIATSDVSIDLNGHIINTWSATATTISASSVTNIKISNGILMGASVGISIANAAGGGITLEGLTITGFDGTAISITGAGPYPAVHVTNSVISCNGVAGSLTGIYLYRVWGGSIASNTFVGNSPNGGTTSSIGITLNTAYSLLIRDNDLTYWWMDLDGNSCGETKVVGNNLSYATNGIYFGGSTNIDVEENLLSHDTSYGLETDTTTGFYRNNTAPGDGTNYLTSLTSAGGNV